MYRAPVSMAALRGVLGRGLERGFALPLSVERALGRIAAPLTARAVARRLALPHGVPVVAVGGATLGGSGKTRVALGAAVRLAELGARVVLVGHAYRARPGRARVVHPSDALEVVGDEALACARALERLGVAVEVLVAPSRAEALRAATGFRPDVLVVDGLLQARPRRVALSVLALDHAAPWGAGALPPVGDLRAPPSALLDASDVCVRLDATPAAVLLASGERAGLERLAGRRIGLFTAIGRPSRLRAALEARGIVPAAVVSAPDHGPVTASVARALAEADPRVELWVATDKCSLHLPASRRGRLGVLEPSLAVPRSLDAALRRLAGAPAPTCVP